jgi:hypothetical protein
MDEQEYRRERERLLDELDEIQGYELTPELAMRMIQTQTAIHDLADEWAADRDGRRAELAEGVRSGQIRTEAGSPGRDRPDPYSPERDGARAICWKTFWTRSAN